MADKNILMKRKRSDGSFDDFFPVSKAELIQMPGGNNLANDYIRQPGYGATSGTSTAYILTLSPALPALIAGVCVAIKAHTASGANPTLNVNGLGAKSIKKPSGSAAVMASGGVYTLRYDGTAFILQGEGSEERSGHVTAQSISRSGTTLRFRPQEGYYPGDAANSVQWNDPNWIAANIPEDLSIFGLQGALVRGKKWASGTAGSNSTVVNYVTESGANSSMRTVQVSGIDFLPSVIILLNNTPADNSSSVTLYSATRVGVNSNILATGGYSSSLFNFYRLQSPASVSASGFALPVQNPSRTYSWLAIE